MDKRDPARHESSLFGLHGKVAVVSGASRGIGEAIARLLAEYGAHVIICSRKVADCEKVAQDIERSGGKASAMECHIGNMEHIERLFDHVGRTHNRLDIVVNNAATNPYIGPMVDADVAAFQKTMDVNVRGYFFCSTHAIKLMRQNGGGNIVNIASIGGRRSAPMQGIYSITKAAVIHMTRCLAAECGPDKIRVNAVLPGLTKTRLAQALFDNKEFYARYVESAPLRRHAEPPEIAGAVLYLASDAASFTTGECITVDGGVVL